MKFSLKWLGDFIDPTSFFKDPNGLVVQLTQAGLEVDSIEDQRALYDKIVTAQIESVEAHPQADRLTVCKVTTGEKLYNIVCGAKNHKKGDKVVLAQVGAVLPKDFKIKKSRIRAIESEGMLVSKFELAIESNKEEGIWILPPETPVGTNLSEILGLNDILFDITVPPNRSDCLSHKGLAREISCLYSLNFNKAQVLSTKIETAQIEPQEETFSTKSKTLDTPTQKPLKVSIKESLVVEVTDKKACPRYCTRLIKGVEIKESPAWLKQKLEALSLKSINNVVDVTNFILWDQGQPLHAFDREKIQNIKVAPAKNGESFTALDESLLTLTEEDLTIRDKKGVLALAGVIGGKDSSITNSTTNIVLEAAYFAPEKIRKSSRRLGIETDSSYRFTRGVDPFSVQEAMDKACHLIQKIAGGEISQDFYDLSEFSQNTDSVLISMEELCERLGYKASSSDFQKWMKNMGCQIKPVNAYNNSFKLIPPSYRLDLKIKEDFIEEFARLEGYNKIPESLPSMVLPKTNESSYLNSQKLINYLSSRSGSQVINYSFCDPKYYKEFLDSKFYMEDLLNNPNTNKKTRNSFFVNNPISNQLSFMKTLLTPDLFKNITHNYRRNNKSGEIYEYSPVFYNSDNNYQQEFHLALGLWAQAVDIWNPEETPNFYTLKSKLEALFSVFQVKGWAWQQGNLPFLHPKKTLLLNFQKHTVGFLGSLHPSYCQKYKIPIDIALAEIPSLLLFKNQQKALKFKAFSNLASVEKDLCFDVPLNTPVAEVQQEIQKTLSNSCDKVEIFDIYKKQDKRFVSFRMHLAAQEKSWTDQELQNLLNKAIQTVKQKFSISLKP